MTELTDNERAALAEIEWALSGPKTLDEIGQRLGLCRERVRVLEREALGKLRRAAARAGLRFEDFIGEPSGDPAERGPLHGVRR